MMEWDGLMTSWAGTVVRFAIGSCEVEQRKPNAPGGDFRECRLHLYSLSTSKNLNTVGSISN